MIFNSLSINNFFQDPNLIRNWGLSLEFKKSKSGRWPGERSNSISDIDLELNNLILSKIFSCYINLKYENVVWKESYVAFQKIKSFSNKKNNVKNIGWIHKDNNWDFAGLIYLTPDMHFESGTSLFEVKKKYKNYKLNLCSKQKINFYKNKKFNEKKYKKELLLNNQMYVEKTRFNNFFNRMICYDANEYHGANNFYSDNNKERLTLVFFVRKIIFSEGAILNKFYNDVYNFDKKIKNKIVNF